MSNCGLNNKPNICRIFASFEEVIATSIPAYSTMFNSVVSTSFQFGLKLVMSSTFLVVQPQHATLTVEAPKTDVTSSTSDEEATVTQGDESTTTTVPPPKTPEQMQQEAETKGLQVRGPDSWSIFPPFFKLHARVAISSLGMDVNTWVGLFAAGVDSMEGIGTSLLTAFQDVSITDVFNSAVISASTATATLFITSVIAASLTSWNPALIWPISGAYLALGTALLLLFNSIPDVYVSRALLTVVAATLGILLIGAYAPSTLGGGIIGVGSLWFTILHEVTGSDLASAAVKSIVNSIILHYFLGVTSATCFIAFRLNPLMNMISVMTGILIVEALWLRLHR